MRVILVTHGKVNPNGHNGISRVVYALNKYSKMMGITSEIWSVVDGMRTEAYFERDEWVTVNCFPRIKHIILSKNEICRKIIEEKDRIDLVHFHMPWLIDKLAIAKACNDCDIPYIVTGHSAYSSSQKQSWKMKLGKIYELAFLNKAVGIHAISREEGSEFKKYGINTDIFVIPNSIEDPCFNKREISHERNNDGEIVKFLFMGELRAQKNIDGLIRAVALLEENEKEKVVFWIVGPDSKGNMNKLKELSEKLGVQKQFVFFGGIFGEERKKLFVEADVYITPSLSEVISLSAIEAMAYGKPCLLTRQSDVSYFYNYNFFVMCENYSIDMAKGIQEILKKRKEWNYMGINARNAYEKEFKWETNIKKFVCAYEKYRKH